MRRILNSSSPKAGATKSSTSSNPSSKTSPSPARALRWGIKVPFDPAQTIYVWFDALLNYITAIGYGTDDDRFNTYLASQRARDRQRHHTVSLRPLAGHAHVGGAAVAPATYSGMASFTARMTTTGEVQKLSKSLGNVVEPMELIEKFSVEGFRYYFMSQCPFGGDGEFSFERFADAYNSGLANNLGNLYSRILTMCVKYFDGRLEGAASVDANSMAARALTWMSWSARCASRSARSNTAPPCSESGATSSTRPTATSRRPNRSSSPRPTSRHATRSSSTWPTGCGSRRS